MNILYSYIMFCTMVICSLFKPQYHLAFFSEALVSPPFSKEGEGWFVVNRGYKFV